MTRRSRRLALVAAVLVLVAVSAMMVAGWQRTEGPCDQYGPSYVPHVIRAHDAAQGMGATGTPADEGQIACVSRDMKRRLDDPDSPNNQRPEPPTASRPSGYG